MRETPHTMRASTPVCIPKTASTPVGTLVKEGRDPTLTPQALGVSINMERRKCVNARHDWIAPNQHKYQRGNDCNPAYTVVKR